MADPAQRRRPARAWIPSPALSLALLAYLLLALVLTWPLGRDPGAGPPRGTESSATVPLFNLWTLAWNHDRLAHGYRGYWDAPIFHPEEGTFALSEPQPLTGLLTAPLAWATGSEVVAYNLFLLAALGLNGFVTLLLLRALGLPLWIAGAGGAAMELLPFVHQELGVLQLVSLAGLLALMLALLRLGEEPTRRRGIVAGLAFAATYLLCGYYGVFALVAVGPAALWWLLPGIGEPARRRGLLEALALAAGVSLVLVAPVALGQLQAARSFDLERSPASIEQHSARPGQYLRAPWAPRIPAPGVETAPHPGARAFFPGPVKTGLAVALVVSVGLGAGRRRRGRGSEAKGDPAAGGGRHVAVFATLVVLAGWLSLGPGGGAIAPYPLMKALVPGFASLRSLFRLAVLVQLGIVVLAALALGRLARSPGRRRGPGGRRAPRLLGLVLPVLLALLMVGEAWPGRGPILVVPSASVEPPWLEWVRSRTERHDALVFFPFPRGRSTRDYTATAQWMYWQTFHWRPMVNGYSGYFPDSFRELKERLSDFPSARGLAALVARDVRYCVVLSSRMPPGAMRAARTPTHELRRVYRDPPGLLEIYRIVPVAGGGGG